MLVEKYESSEQQLRLKESELKKLRATLDLMEKSLNRLYSERENLGATEVLNRQIQETLQAIQNLNGQIQKIKQEIQEIQGKIKTSLN